MHIRIRKYLKKYSKFHFTRKQHRRESIIRFQIIPDKGRKMIECLIIQP